MPSVIDLFLVPPVEYKQSNEEEEVLHKGVSVALSNNHTLCHGRQVDQRKKLVHKTSTAHLQIPLQHTCNQVINYASPFPLTDQTNFLSPPASATANNETITKLASHDTS